MIPFPYQTGGAGLLGSDESRELLWDVASAVNPGTFDLGSRRATGKGAGAYHNFRATRPLTGLAYFEVATVPSGGGSVMGAGLVGRAWPVAASSYIGATTSCCSVWLPSRNAFLNNAIIGTVASAGDSRRIQIAVRVSTRRVWCRLNGGAYLGGGDPAADTTPTATLAGTDAIFAAGSIANALSTATISAIADHLNSPPAGFTAWG